MSSKCEICSGQVNNDPMVTSVARIDRQVLGYELTCIVGYRSWNSCSLCGNCIANIIEADDTKYSSNFGFVENPSTNLVFIPADSVIFETINGNIST